MIELTRLNHDRVLLNSDLIDQVDITPETVVTLTNSYKFIVRESADELVRRVLQHRQSIASGTGVVGITLNSGLLR
jgi:flagellar protein FlbD